MAEFIDYLERVRDLNPSITVRSAQPEDGESFVQMFNQYYQRKTSLAYFKWQFFESPFTSRLFMAFDGERLAGYYGVKEYFLSNGNKIGFAIDFLTDDFYRKKGIAFLLENEIRIFCRENKIDALAALPNRFGNAAFKALGWRSIANVDNLVVQKGGVVTSGNTIEDNNSAKDLISFQKNNIFREWRYKQSPFYTYEYITIAGGSFAIIKVFVSPMDGKRYQDIVEFNCNGNGNDVKLIIAKIAAQFERNNIETLTTWALPHSWLYTALKQLGFVSQQQQRFFCVKSLDEITENLNEIENWNLEQIDAEIY